MHSATRLSARAATWSRLVLLFAVAFGLSLWWSDAGLERPQGPAFAPPPPPAPALAPAANAGLASPFGAGAWGAGIASVAPAPAGPAAPAAPPLARPHEHTGGDNAPGIGLEPEPEPAPE